MRILYKFQRDDTSEEDEEEDTSQKTGSKVLQADLDKIPEINEEESNTNEIEGN